MGVHCVADCIILTHGCVEASTVMNRNRQVNLMKHETIGIIFNLDLDSGVERDRGLGEGKKRLGREYFELGHFHNAPFPSPHPIPLPPKYSMTVTNLI